MSNVNTHVHMMLPFKREGYLVDKKALVVDLEEALSSVWISTCAEGDWSRSNYASLDAVHKPLQTENQVNCFYGKSKQTYEFCGSWIHLVADPFPEEVRKLCE